MRPVVETAYGAVRGVATTGPDGGAPEGVAAFKNIPYAAAPVGPNRFLPPRPPAAWSDVREAAEFGPTAPKAPYVAPFDVLLPEPDVPGDEFLNLNVWTRDVSGSAPVLVWLHGGAFVNGTGSARCYDGTAFARDGVVLVTLNYRLGVEGFLLFGEDDATPNLGLLDQIAALRWVRENIGAFGGDPERVTVFGESAGAMSIGALLAMPDARGLFHRAILESGAAHHSLDTDSASRITRRVAEILDISATRTAFGRVPAVRLLEAQQRVRAEVTVQASPELWGRVAVNLMPFEPVVDGTVLPRDPALAAAAGETPDIDILIGSNSNEFRLFTVPTGVDGAVGEAAVRARAGSYCLDPDEALAVYRASPQGAGPGTGTEPGELLARLVTDWFYRIPALRLAEAYARRRPGSAFVYEFAWQPPTFGGRLGACHALELPFVFDALADEGFTGLLGTKPPQHLATEMHRAWVAFATGGDPGWAAYGEQERATMLFDLESAVEHDPRPAERELWAGVRP